MLVGGVDLGLAFGRGRCMRQRGRIDRHDWSLARRCRAPSTPSTANRRPRAATGTGRLCVEFAPGVVRIPLAVTLSHLARLTRGLCRWHRHKPRAASVTFNQVVEAVAAADASPAWCLAQAVASSHAAGFLDPKIAREVFGAPDALIAWGPPAGVAKAVVVDGGYRVTGKWRFASGSANATWMGGHSTVFETVDKPRRDASGNPINRTMLFPREQANIKDTWHVIGLRGTASND